MPGPPRAGGRADRRGGGDDRRRGPGHGRRRPRQHRLADPGARRAGDGRSSARRPGARPTRRSSTSDAGSHELKGKTGLVPLWQALRVVSGARRSAQVDRAGGAVRRPRRELRRIKDLFHASADERRPHLSRSPASPGSASRGWRGSSTSTSTGSRRSRTGTAAAASPTARASTYWALADMVRMRARIAEDEEPASALAKLARGRRGAPAGRGGAALRRAAARATCSASRRTRASSARTCSPPGASSSSGSPTSYPTVMVFEDMQWADASLLDFIEYLLEWSRSSPALRRHARAARAAGPAARPGARRRATSRRSTSSRCRSAAMEELLAGLVPGLPEALRRQILDRAEGMPLYAVETVRMLLDRGALVQEASVYRPTGDDRVARGPGDAARADRRPARRPRRRGAPACSRTRAVLGKTFTKQALAALSGPRRGRARPDPALARRARRSSASRPTPARPSTASTASSRTCSGGSPTRRSRGATARRATWRRPHTSRRRWSERRARRGRRVPLPRRLRGRPGRGRRGRDQGEGARRADPRRRAGGVARRRRGGAALLRAGRRASRTIRSSRRSCSAGRARWRAGRARPARRRATCSSGRSRIYEAEGDTHAAARIAGRYAHVLAFTAHRDEALERMERAFEVISTDEPDEDLALLAAQLARFYWFGGDLERAAERAELALDVAEAQGLPKALAFALRREGAVLSSRRPLRGRPRAAEAHTGDRSRARPRRGRQHLLLPALRPLLPRRPLRGCPRLPRRVADATTARSATGASSGRALGALLSAPDARPVGRGARDQSRVHARSRSTPGGVSSACSSGRRDLLPTG